MITNEEIVAKLSDFRKEKAPQVTDKWIEETAKRLFAKVTEETVLETLVEDALYYLQSTQLTVNSVLKEEALKNQKTMPPAPPTPSTPPTPPKDHIISGLSDEEKELLNDLREQKLQKTIAQTKAKIFETCKTKVNEAQQKSLQLIIDRFNVKVDDKAEDLIDNVMSSYTEFVTAFSGSATPPKPDGGKGGNVKDAEKAEFYKSIGSNLK